MNISRMKLIFRLWWWRGLSFREARQSASGAERMAKAIAKLSHKIVTREHSQD
jgi:hypothetical protein